jgi:NAD(P)-dependent dehydrogenase (short-subunit alcohol dehydrogenase family)
MGAAAEPDLGRDRLKGERGLTKEQLARTAHALLELAGAVLFLASDDSTFVAGSELFVDGGSAQI